MFSKIKDFIYRHRKKFIITGVVIGGSVVLSRYAHKKFIEWQDKETKEFLERTRKQYHFENTERTCNQTILSLAVQLKNEIAKHLDTESLLQKLRSKQDENKLQIWDDLKILSFAKHTALLYCGLMLNIVLRIQVNVIAGFMVKDSNSNCDLSLQGDYLSLCQYFMHTGVKDVCNLVEKHIKQVFGSISLKYKVNLVDIEHLFWSIQASLIEDSMDPLNNLPKYLFSSQCPITAETNELRTIFDHTIKILESDDVTSMAQACIGRAYANSVDSLAEYFVKTDCDNTTKEVVLGKNGNSQQTFIHPNKTAIHMAKVVPLIHGLTKLQSNETDSEPWIYQFIIMDKMKELGLNVFETFSK